MVYFYITYICLQDRNELKRKLVMTTQTYIAFLRGINVGGHHKVPMADLKKECAILGLENVRTLLNSGNIIFESTYKDIHVLKEELSKHLEISFGFSIPIIVRDSQSITRLLMNNPFKEVSLTKDTRLYVSFIQNHTNHEIEVPWASDDHSFQIIDRREDALCSVLDLSISKTTIAMGIIEKNYGKNVTTRNWNTLVRIGKKLGVLID